MLLVSTSTAFRGDSSRNLLWSDLFCRDIPMHGIELGHMITVRISFHVLPISELLT